MTLRSAFSLCTVFYALLLGFGVPARVIAADGEPSARFVRIELPGERRTLTLAEVAVISGGKNIARAGKASQSGTSWEGTADRAIDGNVSASYNEEGQSHGIVNASDPWWELDLGGEFPVEAVRIWNRSDGFGWRLDGFTLVLLDAGRNKVFDKRAITAPESSVRIMVGQEGKVTYLSADGKPAKKRDWKRQQPVEIVARPSVPVPDGYADPLPFAFREGDVIASIGNALGESFQHHGAMEAPIQAALPELELSFRNLCVSGDQAGRFPRSQNCPSVESYLQHVAADVIFCFFGYNESFEDKPQDYAQRLVEQVQRLRGCQPDGESFPRIVLFSPIAHENLGDPNLPAGKANNQRLARYAEATAKAAKEVGVAFVDLFEVSRKLYGESEQPLTLNGIHLNRHGCLLLGKYIARQLTGNETFDDEEQSRLRAAVQDKNWHWQRYVGWALEDRLHRRPEQCGGALARVGHA
jgi:lysophospholipase L1-like esterase